MSYKKRVYTIYNSFIQHIIITRLIPNINIQMKRFIHFLSQCVIWWIVYDVFVIVKLQ